MKHAQKRTILARLALFAVIFAIFFSVFMLAGHGVHNCVGEGCPLCLQAGVLRELLRLLSCAGCVCVSAVLLQSRGVDFCPPAVLREGEITPVSLKDRLLD